MKLLYSLKLHFELAKVWELTIVYSDENNINITDRNLTHKQL